MTRTDKLLTLLTVQAEVREEERRRGSRTAGAEDFDHLVERRAREMCDAAHGACDPEECLAARLNGGEAPTNDDGPDCCLFMDGSAIASFCHDRLWKTRVLPRTVDVAASLLSEMTGGLRGASAETQTMVLGQAIEMLARNSPRGRLSAVRMLDSLSRRCAEVRTKIVEAMALELEGD